MRDVKYNYGQADFTPAELVLLRKTLLPTCDLLTYCDATAQLLELCVSGDIDETPERLLDLARAMLQLNSLFQELLDERIETDITEGGDV